jgi:anaerobic C4-dicarboxylate transporter
MTLLLISSALYLLTYPAWLLALGKKKKSPARVKVITFIFTLLAVIFSALITSEITGMIHKRGLDILVKVIVMFALIFGFILFREWKLDKKYPGETE